MKNYTKTGKVARPHTRQFDDLQVEDLSEITQTLTRKLQIAYLEFEDVSLNHEQYPLRRGAFVSSLRNTGNDFPDRLTKYLHRVENYGDIEAAVNNYHAEPRKVAHAKTQGYKHPGLWAETNTSLLPFRIWADVWRKYTPYAPQPNRDGLDSQGVWGPRASDIARIWYACGCRVSNKFYTCLHVFAQMATRTLARPGTQYRFDVPQTRTFLRTLRKSHSAQDVRHLAKGVARHNLMGANPSVYITIGRCANELVWRSLSDSHATTGHFNFEAAAALQHLPKEQQASLLNSKAAWRLLHNRIPAVFQDLKAKDCPHPMHLGRWNKALGAFVQLMQSDGINKQADSIPAFNLASLFGSKSEVEKYLSLTGKSLHDAGQFVLPRTPRYSREWAGFVLKYPESVRFIGIADGIETALGRVPRSLTECRTVAAQFTYLGVSNIRLAELCSNLSVSQEGFEQYQVRAAHKKEIEMCPGFDPIEWKGYTIRKLDHDDPAGLLLGLMTDCCQHLGGAGAACAIHGYTRPSGAFYVVEYKGRVVAQSWAWRSTENQIVFDSIEGLGGYDLKSIGVLYELASEHIVGQLGIVEVRVGATDYGLTADVLNTIKTDYSWEKCPKPSVMLEACTYSDAQSQVLLYRSTTWGQLPDSTHALQILKTATEAEQGVNFDRLQSGSDVLCEHCGAEVHPLCETCPACNADIREWVEDAA